MSKVEVPAGLVSVRSSFLVCGWPSAPCVFPRRLLCVRSQASSKDAHLVGLKPHPPNLI